MNQLLDGTQLTHPRAGELADLACLVEAVKMKARSIVRQQTELRAMIKTMNSVVKSELRKMEREMEFPQ